jgi:hypothetical protein
MGNPNDGLGGDGGWCLQAHQMLQTRGQPGSAEQIGDVTWEMIWNDPLWVEPN